MTKNTSLNQRDIILIIDDSKEEHSLLNDAFSHKNAIILSALSGVHALEITKRITPDIILMDAIMPGLDGFETTKRIKTDNGLAHIPIIFMTGLSDTENIVKGLNAGGVDYVTKPLNIDEIAARIKVHLANARATQSALSALDISGRYLFATDKNGQILWTTPHAAQLLNTIEQEQAIYLDFQDALHLFLNNNSMAGNSIDMTYSKNYLKLSLLIKNGNDENIFCFTYSEENDIAKLQRIFNLTYREAELCQWLGMGKTNKDIAEILALSPRTVNKHLESIFIKLAVENRAAAAVLIMRILLPTISPNAS